MNIDIECIALLSLILQDSPKDRQLILCVLARANTAPTQIKFHSNTDYPTFYGYSNERIPYYLMGKGVTSNVPREGPAKRLISSHYLSYAETIINKAKNWDIDQKRWEAAKFITLDNKTAYKDTEVFLVFRDKALGYIKDYASSHKEEISSFLGTELSSEVFKTKDQDEPVLRKAIFAVPTYSIKSREIADQFSPENRQFVLRVLKEIVSLVDFSIDGKVAYRLQSPSGHLDLINERRLLKKVEQQGLFKNLGEDGVLGIATLNDLDIKLIKEVIARLEERESGVITSEEFEDTKKTIQVTEEPHKPNRLSELQNRYNKILTEIKGGVKGSITTPQVKIQEQTLQHNLELKEEDIPKLQKDGLTVFTFPNNWSGKYRYFKYLWENQGVKKDYNEVYEFESKLKYPEKGVWRTNRNIRNTINKLRKELEAKKLPIHIKTNKGFTLTVLNTD